MSRLTRILSIAALLALAASLYPSTQPAEASLSRLCRPAASGTSPGPGRWVAPGSGAAYTLDNSGCANIQVADIGDARAAGFVQPGALQSIVVTNITATDFTSVVLPPAAYLHQVIVQNNTANAVTGGVKIGTTSGGTDVIPGITCAANCLSFVSDSGFSKRVFSSSASTVLSIAAITSFNSANLNVTFIYSFF